MVYFSRDPRSVGSAEHAQLSNRELAALLSEPDRIIPPPQAVAELLLTLPIDDPTSKIIARNYLEEVPEAVFHLVKNIFDATSDERSLEILAAVAEHQSPAGAASRRGLITLIHSQHISHDILPDDVKVLLTPLERACVLMSAAKRGSRSEKRRTDLYLDALPDRKREIAETICDSPSQFADTIFEIERILQHPKESVDRKIAAFDSLFILKESLLEKVEGEPEEVLMIVLSAPGLMEELHEELCSLDLLRGGTIAKWLRAGLHSPFFREDVLTCFIHSAVFGSEISAVREELFRAINAQEIDKEELAKRISDRYGHRAAEAFKAELENSDFGKGFPTFLRLEDKRAPLLPKFLRPTNERILDVAESIVDQHFNVKVSPSVFTKIRRSLQQIDDESLYSFCNSIGVDCNRLNMFSNRYEIVGDGLWPEFPKLAFCLYELSRAAMGVRSLDPGYSLLRERISTTLALSSISVSAERILEPLKILFQIVTTKDEVLLQDKVYLFRLEELLGIPSDSELSLAKRAYRVAQDLINAGHKIMPRREILHIPGDATLICVDKDHAYAIYTVDQETRILDLNTGVQMNDAAPESIYRSDLQGSEKTNTRGQVPQGPAGQEYIIHREQDKSGVYDVRNEQFIEIEGEVLEFYFGAAGQSYVASHTALTIEFYDISSGSAEKRFEMPFVPRERARANLENVRFYFGAYGGACIVQSDPEGGSQSEEFCNLAKAEVFSYFDKVYGLVENHLGEIFINATLDGQREWYII